MKPSHNEHFPSNSNVESIRKPNARAVSYVLITKVTKPSVFQGARLGTLTTTQLVPHNSPSTIYPQKIDPNDTISTHLTTLSALTHAFRAREIQIRAKERQPPTFKKCLINEYWHAAAPAVPSIQAMDFSVHQICQSVLRSLR
jgi:hypothetical protein